jgi:transforming growth factor-beta-induced protein
MNRLLYHVLGEEKKSDMLSSGYYNTMSPAYQNKVSMNISSSMGVSINSEAKVITPDVDVKNGVIHVIDRVLLFPTVVDQALANRSFSILVQAVVKAGLSETLSGTGSYTIFAPTNAAFEALFSELGISGIADLSAEQLIPILKRHVVSGNIRSSQLSDGTVETLDGSFEVTLSPVPAINTNSLIVATDVQATNGIVHVINKVLLP